MQPEAATDPLVGSPVPRVGPPRPLRSDTAGFRAEAACLGVHLYPWQETVGQYLYALGPDDRWLYPEVADVVARQNGKTEVLVPFICHRLLLGRRLMHTAQNRELPREVFRRVADHMVAKHSAELARMPRFANGQEEIRLLNGGAYRIVAPNRGGGRGVTNDDLLIDEVRELDDWDAMQAIKPTTNASANPQILYLSNAGDDSSVVLNALRTRSVEDESLAYLEWSAAPERKADDVIGWTEANPSIGHMPGVLANLEREYRANRLAGTMAIFETEHLCRWVASMRERLVDDYAWSVCHVPDAGRPRRPYLGVSMDPKGKRASAVLAWHLPEGEIAVRLAFEATGDPIDTDTLGADLRELARLSGVMNVGYDGLTDRELAKFFVKSTTITGQEFANASSRFALAVQSRRLMWDVADEITDDLTWTTRKQHESSGSYQAVRADDSRPITASLAAIRAVYLASGPVVSGGARIW